MTQKEYNEKIAEFNKKITELEDELKKANDSNCFYSGVLENYYLTAEELKKQREANNLNCKTIQEQTDIIERYKQILDNFTING